MSKVELGKFGDANYQEAIADFLYAEELGSKNPGIFKGIGEAHRLMKDFEKALYYLNEALKTQIHRKVHISKFSFFVLIHLFNKHRR